MAVTSKTDTILIMDDELFNLQWLIDFLESKNYTIYPTSSADEAIDATSLEVYRAVVLDLNVPMASKFPKGPRTNTAVYQKYPGLYVAWHARNQGYRDRQVIIYTVHRDEDVDREAKVLGCTYILKGRPTELKEELLAVLSYDPTLDD